MEVDFIILFTLCYLSELDIPLKSKDIDDFVLADAK